MSKSNGIPVWIDNKPAIAHNKVMIVDGKKVITGSFNFTAAAQMLKTCLQLMTMSQLKNIQKTGIRENKPASIDVKVLWR